MTLYDYLTQTEKHLQRACTREERGKIQIWVKSPGIHSPLAFACAIKAIHVVDFKRNPALDNAKSPKARKAANLAQLPLHRTGKAPNPGVADLAGSLAWLGSLS